MELSLFRRCILYRRVFSLFFVCIELACSLFRFMRCWLILGLLMMVNDCERPYHCLLEMVSLGKRGQEECEWPNRGSLYDPLGWDNDFHTSQVWHKVGWNYSQVSETLESSYYKIWYLFCITRVAIVGNHLFRYCFHLLIFYFLIKANWYTDLEPFFRDNQHHNYLWHRLAYIHIDKF
jgi:hypothetical protein